MVIATARKPDSQAFRDLQIKYPDGRMHILDLDVINPESIRKAAEVAIELLPGGLDYLISNAGVNAQPLASLFLSKGWSRYHTEMKRSLHRWL